MLLDVLSIYGTTTNSVSVQLGYKGYGTPLIAMLEENGSLLIEFSYQYLFSDAHVA